MPDVDPTAITVAHFLRETWLPAARTTIRPTTYSSYEMHVRCYLVPAFGHLSLQQLTAPVVNAFYGELLQGWNGRPILSAATVRRIHATLHRALRDAVRWEMLVRNPAAAADLPRLGGRRSRFGQLLSSTSFWPTLPTTATTTSGSSTS